MVCAYRKWLITNSHFLKVLYEVNNMRENRLFFDISKGRKRPPCPWLKSCGLIKTRNPSFLIPIPLSLSIAEKLWLDQNAHAPMQGPGKDDGKQYQLPEKCLAFYEKSDTMGDVF